MSILKRGLKGAPVKRLQEALGVRADGDFGPATEKAIRAFQESHGLSVDGIAGPDTFAAMGLYELVLMRIGSRGTMVKSLQEDLGVDADGRFGAGTKKALMAFQETNGLTADGMAGPETLAKLKSFSNVVTEAVIKKAEVTPDEKQFDGEELPELKGAEVVKGSAQAAPAKSVWGRIKGWFG